MSARARRRRRRPMMMIVFGAGWMLRSLQLARACAAAAAAQLVASSLSAALMRMAPGGRRIYSVCTYLTAPRAPAAKWSSGRVCCALVEQPPGSSPGASARRQTGRQAASRAGANGAPLVPCETARNRSPATSSERTESFLESGSLKLLPGARARKSCRARTSAIGSLVIRFLYQFKIKTTARQGQAEARSR